MANQFVALPAPAANGPGAWVDVSTYGPMKTITVTGNGGVFEPFVTIEFSNQGAGANGVPLKTFSTPDEATFNVACHWMRAVVSNYKGGGAPTVELGGTDDGAQFAQLTVPPGNGDGAGVDVSALGLFKTVQVAGSMRGSLLVEVSEDGGASYSQAFAFSNPGGQSQVIAADFMRVTRNGVPKVNPGQPEVWVAATNPVGGGGGGSVAVQLNEVDVVNPATVLDFQDPGSLVQDAGSGVARIYATLLPDTLELITPTEGQQFPVSYGKTNVINTNGIDECAAVFPTPGDFPNGIPNGTLMAIKLFNPFVAEGAATGVVDFITQDADSIDNINATTPGDFPIAGQFSGQSFLFVFDGFANWWYIGSASVGSVNEQAFIYTATGSESSAGFDINFPVDMPDTNYIAVIELGSITDQLTTAVVAKTVSHITVATSADPEAGDEFQVFLKAITGVLA